MIEILLYLAAVAAHSAQDAVPSQSTAQAAPLAAEAQSTTQETIAPPAFLSPEPNLVAEDQVPTGKFTTAVEVKPILGVTRANWVAVREYNGQDLLYVTHLWSWRCGLVEMRLGINGAEPEVWPLPTCHADQPAPNAILEQDGLPYRSFGLGSVQNIEVHLTYDDLTTESASFDRQAVRIP